MRIDNKFDLKQEVYLVTDPDQNKRIITAIVICADGGLLYEVGFKNEYSKHYDFELSDEKNILMNT